MGLLKNCKNIFPNKVIIYENSNTTLFGDVIGGLQEMLCIERFVRKMPEMF